MLALLFLTACTDGGPTPAAAVSPASPSPTPSHLESPAVPGPPPPYAIVFVPGSDPSNGSISLRTYEGGPAVRSAQVALAPFRMHALMSWTSASAARLYYLDGASDVRFISPYQSPGTPTHIALTANQQAGFAVSPDDRKIGVAIFTYSPLPAGSSGSPTYAGMRLYVEDLDGGGHHVELFTSSAVAEFPIGWDRGRLVVAVSSPFCCQSPQLNPYAATEYHVVDPATGTRVYSVCANSLGPVGPAVGIGVLCYERGRTPDFGYWDGNVLAATWAQRIPPTFNALSPDGARVAVGGDPIHIISAPNGSDDPFDGESGSVLGWLGTEHIAFQRPDDPELRVLDLNSRRSIVVSGTADTTGGTYMGVFPAAMT